MQRSPDDAVGRRDRRVGGHVDVRVGQHDHVVLGAAQRLDALAVAACRSRRCSCAMGVEPTNETALMSGCSRMRSTATLSPWTTLKTPSGTPASCEQLGDEERRGRVLLRRLEDERVAAGDGVAEHPHRHHGREVERRDAGHDAQRLADLVDVDAAGDLLAVAALQQVRDAASRTRGSRGPARPRPARRTAPCRARRSAAPRSRGGAGRRGCGCGT